MFPSASTAKKEYSKKAPTPLEFLDGKSYTGLAAPLKSFQKSELSKHLGLRFVEKLERY